jgi:hypothetical protein
MECVRKRDEGVIPHFTIRFRFRTFSPGVPGLSRVLSTVSCCGSGVTNIHDFLILHEGLKSKYRFQYQSRIGK